MNTSSSRPALFKGLRIPDPLPDRPDLDSLMSTLAAERDRADRAEAAITKALHICHNYGTRDALPRGLYAVLKPYEQPTA